jgi:hypothetical protein
MPTATGILHRYSYGSRYLRLAWHVDCAARDPWHEALADLDARHARAVEEDDSPGLRVIARTILEGLVHRHHGLVLERVAEYVTGGRHDR